LRIAILLAAIALPFLEIATFIKVGEWIGIPSTIALIILSAVVGLGIIRWQGLSLLTRAQDSLRQNAVPVSSVVHGVFLLVSGILLAIPGFLTDIVAFVLLIPPLRSIIARFLFGRLRRSSRFSVHVGGTGAGGDPNPFPTGPNYDRGRGPVIEGEVVEDLTPKPSPPDQGSHGGGQPRPPSPWRQ